MRVPLNGARLRRELMLRGLDQARFAELANLSPQTISAACRGNAINPSTFSKIVRGLLKVPVMYGAEGTQLLDLTPAVGQ